jgi:hypothetical protein
MALAGSVLNYLVQFLRRPASLDEPPVHAPIGVAQWAGWRELPAQDVIWGGLTLAPKRGRLTVRDSAFARTITTADRAQIEGVQFTIRNAEMPALPTGGLTFECEEAPSAALYARKIQDRGDIVILQRRVSNAPAIEVKARAIVTGYQPNELAAGVMQGARRVFLFAPEVIAGGFPLPIKPRSTDRLIVNGTALMIQTVDDSTHRVAGELFVYDIQAVGS